MSTHVAIDKGARKLAKLATEQYNRYEDKFIPLEDLYIASTRKSQAARDAQAGILGTEAAIQYAPQINNTAKTLMASGVNPNSGMFIGGLGDAYAGLGKSLGQAKNQGSLNADNEYYNRALNISGMGINLGGQAMNTMSQSQSNQLAAEALATESKAMADHWDTQRETSTLGGLGTAIGMGGMAYLNRTPSTPANPELSLGFGKDFSLGNTGSGYTNALTGASADGYNPYGFAGYGFNEPIVVQKPSYLY